MINYLLDPFIQIENIDGLPVVGAKVYVYYTGSRTLAPIYSDKEGTHQSNPAITDTLGNVTIFADTASFYDVFVYDNNDQFLFSKEYVAPNSTNDADVPEIEVEAGFGIQVHKRYQGNKAIYNVAIDQNETATAEELAAKQDKLTAGANIEITDQNVINVVQRKELVTETPLKIQRTSNRIKLYLDPAFTGDFKHTQDEVIIGGSSANYISKITQNENGNVSADVGNFVAGSNINIANNNGNLTISGKDWNNDITAAVSGKLDTSTYNTFVASTNSWDKTAYSGGTGITVSSHQISVDSTIATKSRLLRSSSFDKSYSFTHTVAADEQNWIYIDVKQAFRDFRTYIFSITPNVFDVVLSPVIMHISGSFNTNISNNGFCYVGLRPFGVEPISNPAARQLVYLAKISNGDFTPKPSEYGKGAFYTFAVETSDDIMTIAPNMSSIGFDLATVDSSQTIWHVGDTFTLTIRFICTSTYRNTAI